MYGLGTLMRIIYTSDTRLSNHFIVWFEEIVALALHALIIYGFYKFKYT